FGQSTSYGSMAPGLDFAFGFYDESFVDKAKGRGWLMTDDGQTSPANFSNTNEIHLELVMEPLRGLKIQLTTNRTDNRNRQTQFMFDDMPTSLSGSYTKTHIALATSLKSSKAQDGYASKNFTALLDNIPIITDRIESGYAGSKYPDAGFMAGKPIAGTEYNPELGRVSETSSDVLIPAFLAAYSGRDPRKQYLNPFPGLSAALPNWRVTYDGLSQIEALREKVKSITLTHSYQCTYSVGNYGSFINWIAAGETAGFIPDELTGNPIPSGRYNISTVSITERFAPLIGVAVTLKNNMTLNAEWRDQRTVTLNCAAGQIVEALQRGVTFGMGYKITGFNSVLKIRGQQKGINHDLQLNGDLGISQTQALIRRIETAYTQATSGTRTLNMNLKANYQMSRRLQLGAYLEHQANMPIVSSTSYPTSSTAFGISMSLNLAR
ncbi:MAG: cell surface protein SprA, partial [Paramuribaculum sp.]|nr:cell surface protein SprA [Paramuribaculum sp.]